ncbi:MAG: hypothetical protein M3276_02870, partial [Actinomycetota bacterium]|nr:hypothetical protein [Actinomycetota bacterium]
LTGPSFFATAIEGYYRTQYGVSNLETPERRHMVEPGALARVVDLGWLTAESENQLGKEDAPAKGGAVGEHRPRRRRRRGRGRRDRGELVRR